MDIVSLINILVSSGLFVLIWLVQLAHYPMFEFIEEKVFSDAMSFHQRAISYIVIPLIFLELGVTFYYAFLGRPFGPLLLSIVGAIWLSTFLIQVPLHQKLLIQKDDVLIRRLVKSNWIRTVLWSLKLLVVAYSAALSV